MPPLSGPLVPYKGTERQINDIFAKIKGFAVNWCCVLFIQISDEILLAWENYADVANIIVNFINCNNGL